MKIALVHDYLNQMGGAENVLEEFCKIFPNAPVYTSIVDRSVLRKTFDSVDIRSSFIQNMPFVNKLYKKYLPLYPLAFERMQLKGYDCILSMSSGFAKGVSFEPGICHINYCLTPMRFAWMFKQYNDKEKIPFYYRPVLMPFLKKMRAWDISKNINVFKFITLSTAVQKRIKEWYNRDADVIYPPVNTEWFKPVNNHLDYFLVVSRLRGYKRIDLAVNACTKLQLPLKIIGTGDCMAQLKKNAGPTIEFLGYKSDKEVIESIQKCKAFIFPGEEDFGIAPVEAQAAGRPVIAYKAGGALDTIIENETGVFFNEPTTESLIDAINRLNTIQFDKNTCRNNALRFSTDNFHKKIKDYIHSSVLEYKSKELKLE
jgi:glycosyltransferase involved in cell wall biosynthesis